MMGKKITTSILFFLFLMGVVVADCRNAQLYSYSYTTGSNNDIVDLNFSTSSIIHENATNFNCTNELGLYSKHILQVNTTYDKTINCYVWDDLAGLINHSNTIHIANETKQVDDNSLQKLSYVYSISLKTEEDLTDYNATNSTLFISFLCNNYEKYVRNISEIPINFDIGLKENPIVRVYDSGNFSRLYETESNNEDIILLIPENLSYYLLNFNLKDYTGLFTQSYLIVQRFYGDSPYTIYKKKWAGDLNINSVPLLKNQEYKVIVKAETSTRDYGFLIAEDNEDVSITITEIPITSTTKLYEVLSISQYSNITTNRIYFYYKYDGSGDIAVNWWLYNRTTNDLLYHTNSTTSEGLLSYSVPDNTTCYISKYKIVASEGTDLSYTTICFKSEDKFLQYNADFDIAGFNFQSLYPMFIVFISLFVASLGTIYNFSFLGLLSAGVILLAKYWGWLDGVPDLVIMSIVVIAILGKLSANRRGFG